MADLGTDSTAAPRRSVPRATAAGVVIVSFNTRDLLEACLASVLAEGPAAVVVVDNASKDGSGEMVRERYPEVGLLVNAGNPGYGAGANQGIAQCNAPVVVLLNGDTALRPGALAALQAELDCHPEAAVVGPRLLSEDGNVQPSCFQFPGPLQSVLRTTFLGALADRVPALRRRYRWCWSPDSPETVPWVLGAALALRRDAFDAVGGFDPSFFMFSEEVDLCYRLALAGWRTRFTTNAEVVHVGGASTRQNSVEMEVRRYAETRRFYGKHYPPAAASLLTGLVTYRMLHNLARDALLRGIARDPDERAPLSERMVVWRAVLRSWGANEP